MNAKFAFTLKKTVKKCPTVPVKYSLKCHPFDIQYDSAFPLTVSAVFKPHSHCWSVYYATVSKKCDDIRSRLTCLNYVKQRFAIMIHLPVQ